MEIHDHLQNNCSSWFQVSFVYISYQLFVYNSPYYRWIKSHQINIGLLSDKEYIISSRKSFCEAYVQLIEDGWEPHCLDETFVNGTVLQI